MSAAGDIGGCRMGGGVIRFERPVASLAVITKLVELGYLLPGARHRATAVERAIDRLRSDLGERFQSSNHMGCLKRPHSVDGKPRPLSRTERLGQPTQRPRQI
jgi:hypothetical protein